MATRSDTSGMTFAPITPGECARKIREARRVAVLSGAGLSTAAGVPDFRGPKGLYVTRAYDPEKVFEIGYFARDPKPFYQFTRDFLGLLMSVEPTLTHRFLSGLEAEGRDLGIVTQNIDGLHQRAGSRRVLPMHGDYTSSHCRRCGRGCGFDRFLELLETMDVPLCDDCGGVIKPDVVFFGETVRYMEEAVRLIAESDLLLVLGSSLVVYPAAMLPSYAGGEVVIVNRGAVGLRPGEGVYLADAGLDEFFAEVEQSLRA